uniref:Uncharacterized protein n=1 Tax=Anguilla anguilla TaxID=7936 RepID=A0A0E9X7S7_ANGAN
MGTPIALPGSTTHMAMLRGTSTPASSGLSSPVKKVPCCRNLVTPPGWTGPTWTRTSS